MRDAGFLFPVILAAAVALAASPVSAQEAAPPPGSNAYPGFDVRYGIPEGTKLAQLVDAPALISMIVEQFKDPASGEHRLSGFGDAQAVYEVPMAAVLQVLEDYEHQKSYSPNLFEVKVESREGNRTIVYQDLGMSFLGLKASYKIRVEVIRDDFPDGAVGIRARLVESVDGKLFQSYSSWYLKPVELEGKKMLYLRIFTGSGIRRPIIGMAAATKGFTPGNLKGQLRDTVKEARKRLAAK
jgi:hypothetical protein